MRQRMTNHRNFSANIIFPSDENLEFPNQQKRTIRWGSCFCCMFRRQRQSYRLQTLLLCGAFHLQTLTSIYESLTAALNISVLFKPGVIIALGEKQRFSMVDFQVSDDCMTPLPMKLFCRGSIALLATARKLLNIKMFNVNQFK